MIKRKHEAGNRGHHGTPRNATTIPTPAPEPAQWFSCLRLLPPHRNKPTSNRTPHLLQPHLGLALPNATIAPKPSPELKRREALQQLERIRTSLEFRIAARGRGALGDDVVVDQDAGEDADGGAVEGG